MITKPVIIESCEPLFFNIKLNNNELYQKTVVVEQINKRIMQCEHLLMMDKNRLTKRNCEFLK